MVQNDVFRGKENWLFLFQGGHAQFDYLTEKKIVTGESIEHFSNNIKSRQSFCKSNNIKYKHIIFPSKPLIKTDYLSEEYQKSVKSLFNRSYKDSLAEETKEVIWYLLEYLKKEDSKYSTFLKYDTHMTDRAYLGIVNYLLDFLDVPSIKKESFTSNIKLCGGDLFNMIKHDKQNEEEFIEFTNDKSMVYDIGNRGFLKGNSNEVSISHSFEAENDLRLLIFGDSFFKDMLKFLKPFFRDILYIRSDSMEYDIIHLYKPDIIFTGNAERYFSKIHSDDKTLSFLWRLYGNSSYNPSPGYMNAFSANLSYKYKRQIYLDWVNEIENITTYSLKLTNYKLNKYIELIDSKNYLRFKSLGSDPYITYLNVDFKIGKKYALIVNLYSIVDTVFQVFYEDSRAKTFDFLEENSVKRMIVKGSNYLYILLDFPFLGTKLRVDPMNTLGEMEIIDMLLEEI